MANNFKQISNDAMPTSANTPLVLYTVPSSTTTVGLALYLCNMHTSAVTVSVQLTSGTSGGNPNSNSNVYIIKNVNLPVGSTINALPNKITLQTTDDILIDCSVSGKIDASFSVMEIT